MGHTTNSTVVTILLIIFGLFLSSHWEAGPSAAEAAATKKNKKKGTAKKVKELCGTCKALVTKFEEGVEKTSKSIHFRGEAKGWKRGQDNKFLGKYEMNEARLVEILEGVCASSDHKCNSLRSDVEEDIEEWWAEQSGEEGAETGKGERWDSNLGTWLCTNHLKVCCSPGTYGSKCRVCPGLSGSTASVCSGNGACDGDGTRSGKGTCACRAGYAGKACESCASGHFLMGGATSDGLVCSACHASCAECSGPDTQHCSACKSGYTLDETAADGAPRCVDIDECIAAGGGGGGGGDSAGDANSPCRTMQYCQNNPGSFACLDCHSGCAEGCTGPGLLACLACKDGYEDASGHAGCVDIDECLSSPCTGDRTACENSPGAYECVECDAACKTGCSRRGADACNADGCATGYDDIGKNGTCVDINECTGFPCAGAMVCDNTPGSYSCKCERGGATAVAKGQEGSESEECAHSDAVSAALLAAAAASPSSPHDHSDASSGGSGRKPVGDDANGNTQGLATERGSSTVGPSENTWAKTVTVSFKSMKFTKPPSVGEIKANNECCGDEFRFTVTETTTKDFTFLVERSDTQSGWGQDLAVDWVAEQMPEEGEEAKHEEL